MTIYRGAAHAACHDSAEIARLRRELAEARRGESAYRSAVYSVMGRLGIKSLPDTIEPGAVMRVVSESVKKLVEEKDKETSMMHPVVTAKSTAATQWPPSVPAAYQAWARLVNAGSCGGFQARDVLQLDRDGADPESVGLYAAEYITRATFETAMALFFDRTDSHVDLHAARFLHGLSRDASQHMRNALCKHGVVLRPDVRNYFWDNASTFNRHGGNP